MLRPSVAPRKEGLPSPSPVHARRRAIQPHRVPIADPERRKQRRKRVTDQRRVEMLQVARSDHDGRREASHDQCRPRTRLDAFERLAGGHRQPTRPLDVARVEHALVRDAQHQRRGGEQNESRPDRAQLIAEDAKQERWEESAQTTERADQTRDRPCLLGEVLRHKLEDRAVAQAHQHRARQRTHRERHHGRPGQQQREQRRRRRTPMRAPGRHRCGPPASRRRAA